MINSGWTSEYQNANRNGNKRITVLMWSQMETKAQLGIGLEVI
jgi:hypothetical protein